MVHRPWGREWGAAALWLVTLKAQIMPNLYIHMLIVLGGGAFGRYISGFSSCSGNIPGKRFKYECWF